ncbi:hypothetical protein CONPUDRAFT_138017 [Coniophora puteana RWD-64-598 SS2]|uniref:Uncharacterized protein n=1 Tax=Coniophora puteana (strain RWD-64-598) TaxID=741705 RepID=A0A5M3ML96_CONPW|nr:uncharacterized protein CONPUDRAFT_138017 [Coniophora puteana RWD-64-598 SS2]EIW79797.1 hypothetical protein CONPUDRAFT_138017 [Coniophora puteana RWD-64-598 SS2]
MADERSPHPAEERLASYFDKSAEIVRGYAGRFEDSYEHVKPAMDVWNESYRKYPVITLFVTLFGSLSLLPVLSFLGITVFTIATLAFVAVCSVGAASIASVFLFAFVLLSLLSGLFLFSILATIFGVVGYLTFRLATLIRADGRAGVLEWAEETKGHIARGRQLRAREASPAKDQNQAEDSEGSEMSHVVVKHDPDADEKRID